MVDRRGKADVDYLEEEEEEAIRKSADEQGINLRDYDRAIILPSPPQAERSVIDEVVEDVMEVSSDDDDEASARRARLGSLITIRATLTSTITTTSTSTVGTVGLTLSPAKGDTQTGCPSANIMSYMSVCPNACTG